MTNPFSRIIRFFRKASPFGEEQLSQAAQLVERARCNDQVAIATICMVRENAKKGVPLAKKTLEEIIEYGKKHPPKPRTPFGAESDVDTTELQQACFSGETEKVGPAVLKVAARNPDKAAVALANCCNVSSLATAIDACLEDDTFSTAFANPSVALQWMKKVPHDTQHGLMLGYVLGVATRLQMVRNPKTPLAYFSEQVAAELS